MSLAQGVAAPAAGLLGAGALAQLASRVRAEDGRNADVLNLVPSENRPSPLARSVLGADFGNRYFFNDELAEDFWQYRGAEPVGDIETAVTKPALARLARAEHVNVRPVSGMSAMTIALLGLAERPGSAVVCVAEDTGGHYATGSLIGRLGRTPVPVRVERGQVDVAGLRRALSEHPVALVYLDLQNSLWELDVARVVEQVRAHGGDTRVHVDCSHTLGLVLGGAHTNPLDAGADSLGGSTHKSFPGPHKGVLMTRDDEVAARLRAAQFHLISTHHLAHTLSLGLAAAEFEHFGAGYAHQVLVNSRAFGTRLAELGFDLVPHPGVTDTHQVWVRLGTDERVRAFSDGLAAAGVRVNMIPGLPGATGLALRLGVSELTFRGARAESFEQLATAFAHVRDGRPAHAASVRREVLASLGTPFHFGDEVLGDG
ncbi:glycine hydroxymethyltransferase [Crossiella equi]|uniref:Glycine hydroxymethyltransferase n=1 Tax=Crossiella equi TaxID=130796 RepID=A0ABS5A4F2_9PSEU|nr:DegT/DnrJ/EryC1/StrS family aminotransferase [Crossiella equi]MBP2471453.1 glycine hydroxymethyltransferase [Crossiella equi]